MRSTSFALLLLAGTSVSPLSGDVMVRFHNEMKFGVLLPQPISDRTRGGALMLLPDETTIYRKGNLEYLRQGSFVMITDYGKEEVTLMDGEHKQFAKVAMKDYVAKISAVLPPLPPDEKDANSKAKITYSPLTKTGKTADINGVHAEEVMMTAAFDVPMPPVPPGTPKPSSPLFRAKLVVWVAQSDEAARVPAVKELAGRAWTTTKFSHSIDPANVFAWVYGAMPGLGDCLNGMLEAVEKTSPVVLKWHLAMGEPGMVPVLKKGVEDGNKLPEGANPEAPFSAVDGETQEISTEKIPDAKFTVPSDYKAAPFDEVAKAIGPLPKS